MAKEETLAKVEAEIAQGKLGIARDRLMGLLGSYPDDLDLYLKLGEVNWKLGYPIEAGRFWILSPEADEVQQIAIRKFLDACMNDPQEVLRRLGVKNPDPEAVIANCAAYAREEIADRGQTAATAAVKRKTDWMMVGCGGIILLLMASVVISVITVIGWLIH